MFDLPFVQKGSLSTTLVCSYKIWWLWVFACTAIPLVVSHHDIAYLCSFWILLVSPMYVSPHSQETSYTTPLVCSIGGLPFTLVRRLLSVRLAENTWFQSINTSAKYAHLLLSRMEGIGFLASLVVDLVRHHSSCCFFSCCEGSHSWWRPFQSVWVHSPRMYHRRFSLHGPISRRWCLSWSGGDG